MPRRGRYDDDYAEAKGEYDDDYDDGYNAKQHPTSKHVKEIRKGGGKKPPSDEPVVEPFRVDRQSHGLLIGKNRDTHYDIEDKFDVILDFPERNARDSTIFIEGKPDAVAGAIAYMQDLVDKDRVKQSFRDAQRGGGGGATGKNETSFPALPGQQSVVISVDCEKFAHGLVIGKQGTRLNDLKKKLAHRPGTPNHNKMTGIDVAIPAREDTSSIISVTVPEHFASHAEQVIRDFFNFYEISQHLRGITNAGTAIGASLAGDTSTAGQRAAPTKKGGAQQSGAGGKPTAAPTEPAHGGGGGGARASAAASAASRNNDDGGAAPPSQAAAAMPVSNIVPGSYRGPHGLAGKAAKFTDLVATHGYSHEVLPQRQQRTA